MEKKKKKLTLSVSLKKPYNISNYSQSSKKKSVIIENKPQRRGNERRFYNRDSNLNKQSQESTNKSKANVSNDFARKNVTENRNFQIRKLA